MEQKENFIALRKTEQLVKLPILSRAIYAEIESLSSKTGSCFATNAYFAQQFRVSAKTVSAHIANLKRLNLIEIGKNPAMFGGVRIMRIKKGVVPPMQSQNKTGNSTDRRLH